jgi:hypothetical protein
MIWDLLEENALRFLVILLAFCPVGFCWADEFTSRKILFFDLWKLDSWENIELRQGEPTWIEDCDYHDPSFADRGIYFPSVWIDPATEQWRMVYSVKWSPLTLMVATSADGITWSPLSVEGANPGVEKVASNHLLTVPSGSGGGVYQDPRRTDGYAFRIFGRQSGKPVFDRALKDPNHHWHQVAKSEGEKQYIEEGITLVSKDGLKWEVKTGGDWNWQTTDWYPEPPVFTFWNESRQRHVMVARPGWGDRRQVLRSSKDLHHWTDPELQFQPDSLDTGSPIGMYGMPVIPVGHGAGYIGLLWIFHNSSSEPVGSFNQFYGKMDAQLTYSYDGVRFFRGLREPFLKLNPIPQPGCTQIRPCSVVETDDFISVYSEGHRAAHGRERGEQRRTSQPLGSLMLHRLRKDGWMYLASRGDWARMQTKPFVLLTPEISINAVASYGELQYQLTDESSEPIEGFSYAECVRMWGKESTDHPLRWKDANLADVLHQPLRLEIRFRQANIYSIEMAHHFLDAHDMWLLKDGKQLPGQPRFNY